MFFLDALLQMLSFLLMPIFDVKKGENIFDEFLIIHNG